VIAGPKVPTGKVREDLVEHIDLAATSLAMAGIAKPGRMNSQDIFGSSYKPREAVFAARDRADETVDWIRSVRTDKYKYIRNGFPSRPYLQPNNYKDSKAIVQAIRQWHAQGKLNAAQSLIMAQTREIEELYDLEKDPDELNNLAKDAAYGSQLEELRGRLIDWQKRTGDNGQIESPEIYDAEAGADHLEGGKGNRSPEYQKNLELMKRWYTEKPFVPLTP
jgi:arylsulfatase A-like enzyme